MVGIAMTQDCLTRHETVRSWSKRSDLCQTDLVSGPQPTLQVPGDPPLIPSPSSVLALYFSYPQAADATAP